MLHTTVAAVSWKTAINGLKASVPCGAKAILESPFSEEQGEVRCVFDHSIHQAVEFEVHHK